MDIACELWTCNTRQMAYHEAYWVAIATAAPVIALANTVAITDALSVRFEAKVLPPARYWGQAYLTIFIISICSFLVQGLALADALRSLFAGKDEGHGSLITVFVTSGLLAVFATVWSSMFLRHGLSGERIEASDSTGNEDGKH